MNTSTTIPIPQNMVCFRYFTIDDMRKPDQERELFTRNRLYFARTSQFVDKTEFAFRIRGPSTVGDWLRHTFGIEAPAPPGDPIADHDTSPELERKLSARLASGMRVCCFTESARNAHLWRNYADNYRGYAVAFRVVAFQGRVSLPRPINYDAPIPELDPHTAFDERQDFLNVVFRKGATFRAEREYRSVVHTPDGVVDDAYVQIGAGALAQVIFGHDLDRDRRASIEAMIRTSHPGCQLLVATPISADRTGLSRI